METPGVKSKRKLLMSKPRSKGRISREEVLHSLPNFDFWVPTVRLKASLGFQASHSSVKPS